MRTFDDVRELSALLGQVVGASEWMTINQPRVDQFAEATGDLQWIHVDQERARTGPYGGTIAHGFLTLSLIPILMSQTIKFERVVMGVNYGLNKVRFPAPMKVGHALRGQFTPISVKELPPSDGLEGFEVVMEAMIESDYQSKPVCVAETISRRYQRLV